MCARQNETEENLKAIKNIFQNFYIFIKARNARKNITNLCFTLKLY